MSSASSASGTGSSTGSSVAGAGIASGMRGLRGVRGGAAWRVGLFTLVGLALLALAVVLAGGHWFVPREAALLRFRTSVYGLQVGAPVVFRGVRVGQVTAVDLAPAGPGGIAIPVKVEFERALLRNLLGPAAAASGATGSDGARLLPALLARGLVAKLAMQSLLTGQLYVDLDLDPARAGAIRAQEREPEAMPAAGALPVIPTVPSQLQSLQAQLEGLDLGQIGRDLSALTTSLRQLLAGPEPTRMVTQLADAAQALQRLAVRLEREVPPLARSAQAAFGEGQRAASSVGRSAEQLAQQVGAAASQVQGQVGAVSAAGVTTLVQVQRSAEALRLAAEALRGTAAEDSSLRLNADRALADVSRAARSLRELAELLERHPEALLRGKAETP